MKLSAGRVVTSNPPSIVGGMMIWGTGTTKKSFTSQTWDAGWRMMKMSQIYNFTNQFWMQVWLFLWISSICWVMHSWWNCWEFSILQSTFELQFRLLVNFFHMLIDAWWCWELNKKYDCFLSIAFTSFLFSFTTNT